MKRRIADTTESHESATRHGRRLSARHFASASLAAALLILPAACGKKEPKPVERPVYEGLSDHPDHEGIPQSTQCGVCHEEAFREWSGSHHAWANRKVYPRYDADAFQGAEARDGKSLWSFTGDSKPMITWTDPDAEKISKAPDMAIGVTPLIQYLVDIGKGRWQIPDMSWDTEKEEWFSIYAGQDRRPHEWGHWSQRGMNWNSQCAWCHMTEYRKGYDMATESYHTTWTEQGVGCAQCHGPATNNTDVHACMVDSNKRTFSPKQWMHVCMTCHSRRGEMNEDFLPGANYYDHYRLALPSQPNLWYPDGHQLDEVYVTTGLTLSKMGHAGVTCLDCHAVHITGAKLPVDDNQVCMECHGPGTLVGTTKSPIINPLEHMFHGLGTPGGKCVDCHMMESPYMGRDMRKDHSFGIPDPLLSKELGVPNACSSCHAEEGLDWCIEWVDIWYGDKMDRPERARSRAVAKSYRGDPEALDDLLAVYPQQEIAGWRATLLRLMSPWAQDSRVDSFAQAAANDPHPLVREASANILAQRPDRMDAVQRFLKDPIRSVRFEATWTALDRLPSDSPAVKEVEGVARHQADQPAGVYRLARLAMLRGDQAEAEKCFRKAMAWDQSSPAPRRDYAVFLANNGRTADSIPPLREAVALDRQNAELPYLLALAYAETEETDKALAQLREAVRRDPGFARAHYNLGLLLSSTGKEEEAIAALRVAEKVAPTDPSAPYARSTIHARRAQQFMAAGEKEKAQAEHAAALEAQATVRRLAPNQGPTP